MGLKAVNEDGCGANQRLVDLHGVKAAETTPVALQKNIGFLSCLGILVGSIIGSGIFVSPKGVLIGSGSIGVSLLIWVLCGLMALIGSLVYVELGTLLPNSGGSYFYLLTAFDPHRKEKKSYWGSLIPFLFFWQFSFLVRPAAMAVQGLATAQYVMFLSRLSGCQEPFSKGESVTIARLLAAVFIIFITTVNCYSNKLSTRMINIITLAKLLAVSFIIISGITKLSLGTNEALKTGFEGTTFDTIASAFYSGTWAYAGWDKLNMVTRELSNPKRDLLRSLISACLLVTSIYVLMNVSYFIVLSKENFLASDAVASDFADNIAGKTGVVLIIISVVISIFGSTLGSNFTCNRVLYAAAREGHMVPLMSFIHLERMTPTTAIAFNGLIGLLMILQSSILGLISLTGFLTALFTFLTVIALMVLRKTRKRTKDDFQVPMIFIILNILVSGALVIAPFVRDPKFEYIFVIFFMIVGIPIYTIFVYYRKTLPGLHKITSVIQKILLVVPPEDNDV